MKGEGGRGCKSQNARSVKDCRDWFSVFCQRWRDMLRVTLATHLKPPHFTCWNFFACLASMAREFMRARGRLTSRPDRLVTPLKGKQWRSDGYFWRPIRFLLFCTCLHMYSDKGMEVILLENYDRHTNQPNDTDGQTGVIEKFHLQ